MANTITIGVNEKDRYHIIDVNYEEKESDRSLRYFTFLNDEEHNMFFGWNDYLIKQYCYKEVDNVRYTYPFDDVVATMKANEIYEAQSKKYDVLKDENELLIGCVGDLAELISELMGGEE